jgi:hypothetical protein
MAPICSSVASAPASVRLVPMLWRKFFLSALGGGSSSSGHMSSSTPSPSTPAAHEVSSPYCFSRLAAVAGLAKLFSNRQSSQRAANAS